MSTNNSETLSKELKSLLNEVRQSLPEIQKLILTPIAYAFAYSENYLKQAAKKRDQAKQLSIKVSQERFKAELQAKSNQMIQDRKMQEEQKIAEEIRAEERERRLRRETLKLTPRKIIHTGLAVTSTIALVIGVARLAPIAERSRDMNKCIDEISLNPKYIRLKRLEKISICTKGVD